MAVKANLVIDQGADYSTSVSLTDVDGNIIVLNNYTVSAQLRKTYSSSNSISFTASINESLGIINLSLTDAQTANIAAGRYVYDVFITNSGITSRIVEGIVTVTPRVTR
jgi:D-Tyr-tRNAtyr deacylase